MKFRVQTLSLFFCMFLFHAVVHAQINLPKVFGNNMVLQRELKIPVWGNSIPGVLVTAELGTVKVTTKADGAGKWMVHFPKFKAGGPYTLKIYEKREAGRSRCAERSSHWGRVAGFRPIQYGMAGGAGLRCK